MGLIDEIREQPRVVAGLLDSARPVARAVARDADPRRIEFVVLAARGTSDHAAIYGQYVFAVRNGLTAALAAPSAISLFGGHPRMGRALVIGISQSGQSPDVVGVVTEAARQGAVTLAITNDISSPLAGAAAHVLELRAGAERAVAATKTYTAELAALAVLSEELVRGNRDPAVSALPEALDRALEAEPSAESAAQTLAGLDRCLVLGRGFDYATSREWALKLQELTRVLAHGYSGADVAHGPIVLAGPALPVLAVVSPGAAAHALAPVLGRASQGGAPLVVVGPSDRTDLPAGYRLLTPALPDWLHPIGAVVPCQLFAYHLARAKGFATDDIAGLDKVTLTR